jgi:hypothetical protein
MPSEPAVPVAFNDEEQAAMDDLMAFTEKVRTWGDNVNAREMVAAVHVLQGFVVQRMLHRLNPAEWSDWYK